MNLPNNSLQARLIRWSEWHALLMTAVIGLALTKQPLALAALSAALSFSLLLVRCRDAWTPTGAFGIANAITGVRLLATLVLVALPAFGVASTVTVALGILMLDGLDGWLARKTGMSSEFGEYFDKEVDAFFMLALCLILYRNEHLGAWILLPGGFRYLFVLLLKVTKPPKIKERATRFSKSVSVFMLAVLLFCLLPLPQVCTPLAVFATLALAGSFALSVRHICTRQ